MADTANKEREYFLAKMKNLPSLCEKQGCPQFSDFLAEEQGEEALRIVQKSGLRCLLWGGFPEAGRRMLGVFPDWMEPLEDAFPIVSCTFSYREKDVLTHRDFLGALMAQQIRREMIGDIVVTEGAAYVFADERMERVLLTQIDQIGRVGITALKGVAQGIRVEQQYEEKSGTLASLRLDAAVSLACGVSRERAGEMINAGFIQKNHQEADKASASVSDKDIFSVRGKGKFRLETDGTLTRKGRIAVKILKYV